MVVEAVLVFLKDFFSKSHLEIVIALIAFLICLLVDLISFLINTNRNNDVSWLVIYFYVSLIKHCWCHTFNFFFNFSYIV